MTEAALQLAEIEPVEEKALTIMDQAKAVKVIDSATHATAGVLWKAIGDMIKEVKDTFDPICDAAHKAHKQATEKRSKYLDPLTAAYKSVKGLMGTWEAEQERLRLAEQRRLEEINRKAEEDRRAEELGVFQAEQKAEEDRLLAAAIAAEAAGDKGGAEALTVAAVELAEDVKAEVAAIMAEPVYTAPVVLPKATPKVQGMSFATRWSASVTDIKALCLAIGTGRASTEYVIGLDRDKATGVITSPSLNSQAVSLKGTICIPGVRGISKRC